MSREDVPVLFGVRVAGDGEVSVLYRGDSPLFDGAGLCPHPEDEAALLASLRDAARGGQPWRFTWRVRHVRMEGVAHPLPGTDGATTLHGYLRPPLGDGDARFRSIVEASPVPYGMNDEHGNITYVNPAFIETFGYSLADIPTLEHWWPRAYPDEEYRRWVVNEWVTRLERARQHGTPFESMELRIQAKDGRPRIAIVGALLLEASVHVVVLLDITERKRAEDAQKLESLGVLAGGIAHDFNNMLMAILGNADVALTNPEKAPARLLAIQASARRASDVANQMLAYAGMGKFVISQIAINKLVTDTARLLEVAISKKVGLRYQFGSNLPRFEGDATQVRQVVMNLITNASEAIGDRSGTVTLETGIMTCDRAFFDGHAIVRGAANCAEGEYVYISVTDDGSGMTREMIERIFEPFYTTKFTGRGLGLSALLGIVHGHSGAVEIDSEVGKGTRVRVLFPATVMAEDSITPIPMKRDLSSVRGAILFVDDEASIRDAVHPMLELSGFVVAVAANGRDAVEIYRKRREEISLVILDLTMPVLDGEQTLRELKTIDPAVKVILSSGYASAEVARRFAGSGIMGFLKKPFDGDDLERAIADALNLA